MNSFTNDLMPGEEVLAICKKNWTFFFNKLTIAGMVIALIFIGFAPIISLIVLAGTMAPTVLEYLNTELVLTNERLRGKKGAFKIATVENKASYFVGNFKTQSNVILNALGSDTIVIESRGVGKFIFTHMKDAKAMSNALYSLGSGKEIHIVNKL